MTDWAGVLISDIMRVTEGSHSGLVRTLGKRVWGNPPRVRISHPPQIFEKGFRTKNMVGAKRRLFCIPPTNYVLSVESSSASGARTERSFFIEKVAAPITLSAAP